MTTQELNTQELNTQELNTQELNTQVEMFLCIYEEASTEIGNLLYELGIEQNAYEYEIEVNNHARTKYLRSQEEVVARESKRILYCKAHKETISNVFEEVRKREIQNSNTITTPNSIETILKEIITNRSNDITAIINEIEYALKDKKRFSNYTEYIVIQGLKVEFQLEREFLDTVKTLSSETMSLLIKLYNQIFHD